MQNLILEALLPSQIWMNACRTILKEGECIMDGNEKLLEVCNVSLRCDDPARIDVFLQEHADKNMIEWMKNNFLEQVAVLDWGYSYGQRIFNYSGINQIENLVKKLKSKPEAKSATINLMDVKGDVNHMPCICTLDFKIRNGRVNACVFFRSQDAGKKLYADILALSEVMHILAEKLDVPLGSLTLFIASLHIYEADRSWIEQCLDSYEG